VSEQEDSLYGLILMAGYVFSDGFTSVFQEKLFAGYKMPTYSQMLYVNLTSACISIISMFSSTLSSSLLIIIIIIITINNQNYHDDAIITIILF
jgi:hypothetical protein